MISLNGNPIEFFSYPNGETGIKSENLMDWAVSNASHSDNQVNFKYESDADIVHLMFIKTWLDQNTGRTDSTLYIEYMPYSRMDRSPNYTTVFTLKAVTDLINNLYFDKVIVVEPHSDVTMALLNHSEAEYPTKDLLNEVMSQIGFDKKRDYLFFPDAGAQKRYADLVGFNTCVGFKHRDFETGKLTGHMTVAFDGFEMPDADGDTKLLILDDLCSRGGTFVMAADKLKDMFNCEIYLFVAHCENTMWQGEVLDHIEGLYCTDSILVKPYQDILGSRQRKVFIHTQEGEWI